MTKRLHALAGAALATALAVPLATFPQEEPGAFRVPGTDTTLKLYGSVQVYGTHDLGSRPTPIEAADWATIVPLQPLKCTPAAKETGQTYFTARTSRFGISSSTPTSFGPLGVKIEGDFNGDASQTYTNSYRFRLRHAYGTLHGFLVGQTWTQFLDFASAPETVDFNGPGTLALIRQAQVRYTFQPAPGVSAGVSLENPANGTNAHQPDVVLKASWTPAWGSLGAGFVTMQYRYPKPSDAPDAEPNRHATQGWGAQLSGSARVLGKDSVVALLVGGDGIGRYLFNTLGTTASDTPFGGFTERGSFKLWRAVGYHLGFTHVWTDRLRSNLVWSQTFLDRNGISRAGFATSDAKGLVPTKRIDQLFVNAFYTVTKNAEVGLEYELGRRHTWFGDTGYQDRLTAVATYSFF